MVKCNVQKNYLNANDPDTELLLEFKNYYKEEEISQKINFITRSNSKNEFSWFNISKFSKLL